PIALRIIDVTGRARRRRRQDTDQEHDSERERFHPMGYLPVISRRIYQLRQRNQRRAVAFAAAIARGRTLRIVSVWLATVSPDGETSIMCFAAIARTSRIRVSSIPIQ